MVARRTATIYMLPVNEGQQRCKVRTLPCQLTPCLASLTHAVRLWQQCLLCARQQQQHKMSAPSSKGCMGSPCPKKLSLWLHAQGNLDYQQDLRLVIDHGFGHWEDDDLHMTCCCPDGTHLVQVGLRACHQMHQLPTAGNRSKCQYHDQVLTCTHTAAHHTLQQLESVLATLCCSSFPALATAFRKETACDVRQTTIVHDRPLTSQVPRLQAARLDDTKLHVAVFRGQKAVRRFKHPVRTAQRLCGLYTTARAQTICFVLCSHGRSRSSTQVAFCTARSKPAAHLLPLASVWEFHAGSGVAAVLTGDDHDTLHLCSSKGPAQRVCLCPAPQPCLDWPLVAISPDGSLGAVWRFEPSRA